MTDVESEIKRLEVKIDNNRKVIEAFVSENRKAIANRMRMIFWMEMILAIFMIVNCAFCAVGIAESWVYVPLAIVCLIIGLVLFYLAIRANAVIKDNEKEMESDPFANEKSVKTD